MSTGLGMSLDDAISKRKQSGGGERRFSKNGPGKFGGKRIFKKRFGRDREDRFDRNREDRFKRDRPFKRDRSPFRGSRGGPRRFESDRKPRFATRFIRRTGAPSKAFEDKEEGAPKRFRENRERERERDSEGSGHVEGAKIKISNLDFNITHKDIMGKAFVEFEKPENAANAIKEYNGKEAFFPPHLMACSGAVLDGKTITVEYDDERAGRRSGGLHRKPISRDNFRRDRDDFRKDRDDFRRDDRREDRFRSEGDWRRDKRDDRDDRDRPFRRRGGFRGGFRRNRY